MIRNSQNKKAILLGNGVNLLDSSQSFSWGALLQQLKDNYDIKVDLDNLYKPFPLAFDEMLYTKPGSNSFHKKLTSLPYEHILTTNYDYSLQKSIYPNFLEEKDKLAINKKESKYSLKRGYKVSDKVIWHIHGELFDSRSYSKSSKFYNEESIMIGYEHYTSYLERIQENIKGKSGSQKVDNKSLLVRLRDQEISPYWTDILFTHNVDIVGQGFDFSENHLW